MLTVFKNQPKAERNYFSYCVRYQRFYPLLIIILGFTAAVLILELNFKLPYFL